MYRSIFLLFFLIDLSHGGQKKSNNVAYNIPDPDCTGVFHLCTDADKERLGRQAIKLIHEQMDDDKDGLIEASEGRDFIHEELESKTDSVRHRRFQNDNLQITFDDLWKQWQMNPVYNWTNDDVVLWISNHVHLSIYAEYFRRNQIDGRMIPRLAVNEKQYLSSVMQIRDPRHKRRLMIKATDVVLFGPPQRTHNLLKDIILVSALTISLGACFYAFVRHRKTQESMNVMLKELETLQKAETDLKAVSGKIKAMENDVEEKNKIDRGLLNTWFNEVQRTKKEADKYRQRRDSTIDHNKQLQLAVDEIEQLRIALRKAEEHARHQSYEAPAELIDLLKRTYHNEEVAFDAKRKLAENAMLSAKEQMTKISKMQKGFLGAVRIAHTGCMDNVSELINSAKERLSDIHDEFEERENRWNRIASLLDRSDFMNSSPTEFLNRSRPTGIDSINSTNDSIPPNKTNNSNINIRAISGNQYLPSQTSQIESTNSHGENPSDPSNSPLNALKRRGIAANRTSTDRLSTFPSTTTFNSNNGRIDSNVLSKESDRENSPDFSDLCLATRSTRAVFEAIPDLSTENADFPSDENENSPTNVETLIDDRRSMSSEKIRRPLTSAKIFKPFQNIRLRKKTYNLT